jgi:hypothetical protein
VAAWADVPGAAGFPHIIAEEAADIDSDMHEPSKTKIREQEAVKHKTKKQRL